MTLRTVLRQQAAACAALGSPFMDRLLGLIADRLDRSTAIGARMLDWTGDIGPAGASVPLRIAGGLHALKLGGDPALIAAYPPNRPSDDALWDAVERALVQQRDFLDAWLNSPPQTNEVRRSCALMPAAALVQRVTGKPLSLIELGASAGLNLSFDRYWLTTPGGGIGAPESPCRLNPDWRGDGPPAAGLDVVARVGCDLLPVDADSAEGQLRLLAYLWPDQPERIALTQAAIDLANAKVVKADAAAFLETALNPKSGLCRFLFHTIAWQYFPKDVQARATDLIRESALKASEESPLAWFSMEARPDLTGAALSLKLWPMDLHLDLGVADFHGRWIDWREPDNLGP